MGNREVFKERSKYMYIINGDTTTKECQINAAKKIVDLLNNENEDKGERKSIFYLFSFS